MQEKKIFEFNGCCFIVHIEGDPLWNMIYTGTAYWAQNYTQSGETTQLYGYCSDSEPGEIHKELNDDCRKVFDFKFCWRGVWEDRIYMLNDDELFCGDLREAADLWDEIEKYLKDKIKADNPDYGCFDD